MDSSTSPSKHGSLEILFSKRNPVHKMQKMLRSPRKVTADCLHSGRRAFTQSDSEISVASVSCKADGRSVTGTPHIACSSPMSSEQNGGGPPVSGTLGGGSRLNRWSRLGEASDPSLNADFGPGDGHSSGMARWSRLSEASDPRLNADIDDRSGGISGRTRWSRLSERFDPRLNADLDDRGDEIKGRTRWSKLGEASEPRLNADLGGGDVWSKGEGKSECGDLGIEEETEEETAEDRRRTLVESTWRNFATRGANPLDEARYAAGYTTPSALK